MALIPKGNVIKYILLKIDPTCSLEIEVSEQYTDNEVEGKMKTVMMAIIRPSTQEQPEKKKAITYRYRLHKDEKTKNKIDILLYRSSS